MIGGHPALRFWLHYVEWAGGVWEDAGDSALVVLPPRPAAESGLSEEVLVTGDPDVAREDGVTLLAAGHPALTTAAEAVLESGDVGVVTLARPRSQPPHPAALLAKARERFPVGHGRIDAVGEPRYATRSVLRVGAVVGYTVSTEDRFQERVECWVDAATGLAVPDRVSDRLAGSETTAEAAEAGSDAEIAAGAARAYQALEAVALRRRQVLTGQATSAYDVERRRAEEYYDAALAALEHRRAAAPADRQPLLTARAASTREERARRLAEIAEKFQARHEIRPYRMHLVQVPVLRQTADVRRGERRYPVVLDWLLPAAEFADLRCPNCGGQAGLVAAKNVLGCALCLPAKQAIPPAGPPRSRVPTRDAAAAMPGGAVGGDSQMGAAAARRPGPRSPGPRSPGPRPPGPRPPERGTQSPGRLRPGQPAAGPASRPAAVAGAGQSGKAGQKLAFAFWEAVVRGEPRTVARLCEPTSPAAALLRLWGAAGPLQAVGITPGQRPESATVAADAGGAGSVRQTRGEVVTRAASHPYLLRWRADSGPRRVVELLPPAAVVGAGWAASGWLEQPAQSWFFGTGSSGPAAPLDPVAQALYGSTLPRRGLPTLLRSLAAWWRVPDSATVLDQYPAAVVAAALERAVCYWSGAAGGTFSAAAAAHAVEETRVRAAATVLQRLLRITQEQPW